MLCWSNWDPESEPFIFFSDTVSLNSDPQLCLLEMKICIFPPSCLPKFEGCSKNSQFSSIPGCFIIIIREKRIVSKVNDKVSNLIFLVLKHLKERQKDIDKPATPGSKGEASGSPRRDYVYDVMQCYRCKCFMFYSAFIFEISST